MKITLHIKNNTADAKNPVDEHQKEIAIERMERALKHLRNGIREVDVYLEDETPTRGRFDGRCRIHALVTKGAPIAVEGHGETFFEMMADGIKRIQHAIEHVIQKKTDKRRRRQTVDIE